MNIEKIDGIYYICGSINEDLDLDQYQLPSGKVKFDLSRLKNMNSVGIRDWVKAMQRLKISPIYLNCPDFFILLLNITRELFTNDAEIESFQIPTTCMKCGREKTYIAKYGVDFFPGKAFQYRIPTCEFDQGDLEAMSDIESDYNFIEQMKNS
jgi:hypothetical protein